MEAESKRIDFKDQETPFSEDKFTNMCADSTENHQLADDYRQHFYRFAVEMFAMRSLVRQAQAMDGDGKNTSEDFETLAKSQFGQGFDHPAITLDTSSPQYVAAIPPSCSGTTDIVSFFQDWTQGDLQYEFRTPIDRALKYFNNPDIVYRISFPASFKLNMMTTCTSQKVQAAEAEFVARERESLHGHLDKLCADPVKAINSFALNPVFAFSFLQYLVDMKDNPDWASYREAQFKPGYCSLIAVAAKQQADDQNWQENIEPWLLGAGGVALGLAQAPLNAVTFGGSGADINVGLAAASVGRSLLRMQPLYERIMTLEEANADLGISSGADCAGLKDEIDRLWNQAIWDGIYEVAGFAAGVIIPGAGKAALQAAAKSGVLKVTAGAGTRNILLSIGGQQFPLGFDVMQEVMRRVGEQIQNEQMGKIIASFNHRLEELFDSIARLGGQNSPLEVGVNGRVQVAPAPANPQMVSANAPVPPPIPPSLIKSQAYIFSSQKHTYQGLLLDETDEFYRIKSGGQVFHRQEQTNRYA